MSNRDNLIQIAKTIRYLMDEALSRGFIEQSDALGSVFCRQERSLITVRFDLDVETVSEKSKRIEPQALAVISKIDPQTGEKHLEKTLSSEECDSSELEEKLSNFAVRVQSLLNDL